MYIYNEKHHDNLCQNEPNRLLRKQAFPLKSYRMHQKLVETFKGFSSNALALGNQCG